MTIIEEGIVVKRTDLRVLKTKKSIKVAFLTLMKEKNYSKITVKDIVDEALINRNTFYLHYLDKDDLLDSLTSECLEKLDVSMKADYEIEDFGNRYDVFDKINHQIFKVMEEDFEFYKVMLGDESVPYFTVKFTNVVKKHFSGERTKQKAFYIEYMVSGFVGIVKLWIRDPGKYTIDEISKLLIEVFSLDIVELLVK